MTNSPSWGAIDNDLGASGEEQEADPIKPTAGETHVLQDGKEEHLIH